MGVVSNLAIKNLTRQKRRNVILVIAIAIGFFVVTFMDAFTSGIVENIENQITELFGGNVLIQGIEIVPSQDENGKDSVVAIVREGNYLQKLVENNNIDAKSYSYYSNTTGQMIFEGKKSLLTVYGRDLSEKELLESFQFVSGGVENLSNPKALVISDKTANSLNLQVGDVVTYTCTTIYGQNTVDDFTIAGIIQTNSLLGTVQAYCHIKTLNNLIGLPEDGYSTFAITLNNKDQQILIAQILEDAIRKDGKNVTSFAEALKTNPKNIANGINKQIDPKYTEWEGTKYGVVSLYHEIPQIKTVVYIVHIVSIVILIVILLIVMVGVSNTYRIVMYERIREIGTMRALGMRKTQTRRVFTTESIFLCLVGAIIGLLLCLLAYAICKNITVTDERLILLVCKGHFVFKFSVITIVIEYLLLIIFTFLSVLGSAKKAASLSPAAALRTIK